MAANARPVITQVVCASLILDERGLLLVREAKPAALGRWSLPGGRLERGESFRDGAAREASEETGLEVEVGALVGIYHCPATLEGGSAVNVVFGATVTGGELRTTADHPEVAFVPRPEVEVLFTEHRIRGRHVRLALAAVDAGIELPEDLIVEVGASLPPDP